MCISREVSTSFGCRSDEKGRSDLYREVAYGILPELVSHVLKLDAQADGLFLMLVCMSLWSPPIPYRRLCKDVHDGY